MPAYLHYGNNKSSVDNKLAQSCWSLVTEKKIQTVTKRILWGGSSFHHNIGSGVATTHHHYHGHRHCHHHHNIIVINIVIVIVTIRLSSSSLLRSLNNDDGDGYENVTYKVKSRCFKLYRAYSISFNSSNVGKFFWSWILKDCIKVYEKKKESCCLVFPSSTKRAIRHFHVVVVQRRLRNVQKSVMRMQSCYLANLNLLCYCRSRWRRRRRCLSSLLSASSPPSSLK